MLKPQFERVSGIEPPFSAWEADIITIIRHPQIDFLLNSRLDFHWEVEPLRAKSREERD